MFPKWEQEVLPRLISKASKDVFLKRMRLKINGEPVTLEDGLTLELLIQSYKLKKDQIVVELNRAVPSKDKYAAIALKDGDEIEIVKFLGGG
jgi:sulfur carrier protein